MEQGAAPLSALGDTLCRMHTTFGPHYGKLAAIGRGEAPQGRPTETVILDRACCHLDAVAARDRIAAHVRALHDAVTPRQSYALVNGELGPDHVLVTPAGEAVPFDIEGLTYFDVEWEHAWL